MVSKSIAFIIAISFITSCSSSWVIRQDANGGVIGYQGYSREGAEKAVKEKIWCQHYQMVSDELRSQNYTYQTTQAVNVQGNTSGTLYGNFPSLNYKEQSNYTVDVPTSAVGTSYWREFTYECLDNPNRSVSGASATKLLSDCMDTCIAKANKDKSDASICIREKCQ